jgi:large subunit ribosomal protein L29
VIGEVTASELREKSDSELLEKKRELEKEKFNVRSVVATSGEKRQDEKVRAIRKGIARICTILRERELQQMPREPLL